jgi:16S rRNA (guanine1516-N2)-methyltransferase
MLQHPQKPLSFAISVNNQNISTSQTLAKKLSLPLCSLTDIGLSPKTCETYDYVLRYEFSKESGRPYLTLVATSGKLGGAITIDFCGGKTEHRRRFGGGRGQPLAKAIGLKGNATPTVIDATAGLGKDAFVIANLGAQVMLIERSPILTALLEDGLGRASHDPEIKTIVTDRMNLVTADAIEWLTNLPIEQYPDVVYMDPMYPHRNKSALVKKEMRVLRELVGDDEDACQLLHVALSCAKHRVTVKRPRTAPILNGSVLNNRKPNSTVESKNTRYDIYVP